jgi:resolvase-like protein
MSGLAGRPGGAASLRGQHPERCSATRRMAGPVASSKNVTDDFALVAGDRSASIYCTSPRPGKAPEITDEARVAGVAGLPEGQGPRISPRVVDYAAAGASCPGQRRRPPDIPAWQASCNAQSAKSSTAMRSSRTRSATISNGATRISRRRWAEVLFVYREVAIIRESETDETNVAILSYDERPGIHPPLAPSIEAVALYARVSSADQKSDLERQLGPRRYASREKSTVVRSVSEIGSGLNGQRAKVMRLLANASVHTIVVEHRDRLTRLGSDTSRRRFRPLAVNWSWWTRPR